MVQSYLEGVKTGVWQLAQASEAVQGAREALGQAHGLLQGMAETTQTLKPLREQVAQHKQLQVLSQLLPRLWAGKCAGVLGLSPPTVSYKTPIADRGVGALAGDCRDLPESNSGFKWHMKEDTNWDSEILKHELSESGLRLSQVALTTLVANLLK